MKLTEQQYQDLSQHPEWTELHRVLAELALVSQAPTQNLAPSSGGKTTDVEPAGVYRLSEKGGNRPPGGLDDDRRRLGSEHESPDLVMLRSADHFRRRLERCHSQRILGVILEEAREALRSYRMSPPPPNPPFGSFEFKMRLVRDVEEGLSVEAAKQRFGVGRSTVYKWMAQYSEDTSWRRRRARGVAA